MPMSLFSLRLSLQFLSRHVLGGAAQITPAFPTWNLEDLKSLSELLKINHSSKSNGSKQWRSWWLCSTLKWVAPKTQMMIVWAFESKTFLQVLMTLLLYIEWTWGMLEMMRRFLQHKGKMVQWPSLLVLSAFHDLTAPYLLLMYYRNMNNFLSNFAIFAVLMKPLLTLCS